MMLTKITKLKGNPFNPRVLRDDKFAKLKKSIEEFPDMLNKRPIVAVTDKDGKLMVLGGNMRLRACQELGLKEVPVILADDWTEEQRREFVIKDNASAGEWNFDMLANEWDAEKLGEWNVNIWHDTLVEGEESNNDTPKNPDRKPTRSDDDFSAFELIMQHDNKLKLIDTLNSIKREFLFERLEESIMELVRIYEKRNDR